jgi:putative endonuclease
MFYVYVLQSLKDKKFYIGYTEVIPQSRLQYHNSGRVMSTKNRKPFELIYYEAYKNKFDALGREKFLKGGSGHKYLKKQLKHYLEL